MNPRDFDRPINPTAPDAAPLTYYPQQAEAPPGDARELEDRCIDALPGLLQEINLEHVAVPLAGRALTQDFSRYSLAPVVSNPYARKYKDQAGFFVTLPENVTGSYIDEGGMPYLDSHMAVGLVYEDELAAVAAARAVSGRALQIVQLQGVTNKANDPETRDQSGLFGGFMWRDTLVAVWGEIARRMDVTELQIRGAKNTAYQMAYQENPEVFKRAYDKVAARMGFVRDDAGNWRKPV